MASVDVDAPSTVPTEKGDIAAAFLESFGLSPAVSMCWFEAATFLDSPTKISLPDLLALSAGAAKLAGTSRQLPLLLACTGGLLSMHYDLRYLSCYHSCRNVLRNLHRVRSGYNCTPDTCCRHATISRSVYLLRMYSHMLECLRKDVPWKLSLTHPRRPAADEERRVYVTSKLTGAGQERYFAAIALGEDSLEDILSVQLSLYYDTADFEGKMQHKENREIRFAIYQRLTDELDFRMGKQVRIPPPMDFGGHCESSLSGFCCGAHRIQIGSKIMTFKKCCWSLLVTVTGPLCSRRTCNR